MEKSNRRDHMGRQRIRNRVCSCTAHGIMTYLESRLLKDLVNREIHPIRCAESCKRKFQKAMYIGDLCAETGHFWWARKVWRFAARLIMNKDYDDWLYVWFDNNRVSLRDVISETEYEMLMRRCNDLWFNFGFPEYAWWDERFEYLASRYFGTSYGCLYAEKFEGYFDEAIGEWEESMMQAKAEQETKLLFRDALSENLPPCAQDFFEYWTNGPHWEDYSWLTYKEEWL